MVYAGHTMGTPYLNLRGAMHLFRKIGLNGIEIRCAKDGQLDTTTADDEVLDLARKWQAETGVAFVCLTSYFRDFYSKQREKDIANLKRVVDIARALKCPLVRLYGGIDPVPEGLSLSAGWDRTVSAFVQIADYSAPTGVKLCVETHGGTLTFSAKDTLRMVREVDRPNVGVLLDYAWIAWAGEERVEEVVESCAPYMIHCHYKDWRFEGKMGKKTACLMGEGSVPWPAVFRALKAAGYKGPLSDEYEKYWHIEDLPEPEIGMKKNMEYVKRFLE